LKKKSFFGKNFLESQFWEKVNFWEKGQFFEKRSIFGKNFFLKNIKILA